MASLREERQKELRFKIMRLVDEKPSITTREISEKVGISNGAAYYCVAALIDKGLVKLSNFAKSDAKSNYIYVLTPQGISIKAKLTAQFLERKREEYDDLKHEILSLEKDLNVLKKNKGKKFFNNV